MDGADAVDAVDAGGAPPEGDAEDVGLAFVTLSPLAPALAREVVAAVSRRVPVPCRIVPAPLAFAAADWAIEGRTQLDADRLLRALEEAAPPRPRLLVALTSLDLGNPIFTFFFGRARRHGRAALVSLARLSPAFYGLPDDPPTTARRAVLEVLHEVGHLAGLAHCDDHGCLMKVTHGVEGIDNRGASLCDACAALLPPDLRPRA